MELSVHLLCIVNLYRHPVHLLYKICVGARQVHLQLVLGIRIRNRIRKFLGLPDPDLDPLVRGTDPAPDPDPFLFFKCVERTEIMPSK